MIRFGLCITPDKLEEFKTTKFDYAEVYFSEIANNMSDSMFNEWKNKLHKWDVKIEISIIRIPRFLNIIRSNSEFMFSLYYYEKAVERAYALGVNTLVFGSGDARCLPANYDFIEGQNILIRFFRFLDAIVSPKNIIVCIEPIASCFCNMLNTIKETTEFAKKVNRKNIRVVADNYHMSLNNEDKNDLLLCSDMLHHVHLSSTPIRKYPCPSDSYDYAEFISKLKKLKYNGRISFESPDFNIPDVIASRKYIEKLLIK